MSGMGAKLPAVLLPEWLRAFVIGLNRMWKNISCGDSFEDHCTKEVKMVGYGGRAESFHVRFSRVNSTSKNRRFICLGWIGVQEQLRDQG